MLKQPPARHLLLLALVALLTAALRAAIWLDNSANRGVTYHAGSAPIPWADGPQIGINAFNLHAEPNPDVITRTQELARDLGAGYVRMQVPWEDIEIAGKGDFIDRRNDHNG